jgi:RNA polymerase-binding transcription factor DksA
MTKPEMNAHRIALQNKRAELTYMSRGVLTIEADAGEMDPTQGVQQRDPAVGTFDRGAQLLRDVRSALGRIEAGTFGICIDCEKEIGPGRLAAVPWSASCIVCQEAADNTAGRKWISGEDSMLSAA